MIVDDDADIGVLLAELLEELGHVVCGIEATEAGAVAAALHARPDLMIVDANLRVGSGVAAVAAIARIVDIPHILMSGDRLPAIAGLDVVLQKPFRVPDLMAAIELAAGEGRADPALSRPTAAPK